MLQTSGIRLKGELAAVVEYFNCVKCLTLFLGEGVSDGRYMEHVFLRGSKAVNNRRRGTSYI